MVCVAHLLTWKGRFSVGFCMLLGKLSRGTNLNDNSESLLSFKLIPWESLPNLLTCMHKRTFKCLQTLCPDILLRHFVSDIHTAPTRRGVDIRANIMDDHNWCLHTLTTDFKYSKRALADCAVYSLTVWSMGVSLTPHDCISKVYGHSRE